MVNNSNTERVIELRSDTFTQPSKEMLDSMVSAEIGDSVYDEDPTVTKLENTVAELFGKDASLFMPSGTMANLIGVLTHCRERGSECIVGDRSHISIWEQGGVSTLGGVYVKHIQNNEDGTFDLDKLETMIDDGTDFHCATTKLVCIENTHNSLGGRILPMSFVENLRKICDKHDVKIHLDGSRIMNTHAATGISVKDLTKHVDSINLCFSKGIGAPVGSALIGAKDYIQKAKMLRKCIGGAMRQTGILAAACLYGLSLAPKTAANDNMNAKRLAEGIFKAKRDVLDISVEKTETNIVKAKILMSDLDVNMFIDRLTKVTEDELKELKEPIIVKATDIDKKTLRFVTHLNVDSHQIDLAIKKIDFVCRQYSESKSFH